MRNILTICHANICRSPVAEALFRHQLQQERGLDVVVRSAGIAALAGNPAAAPMQAILTQDYALDLSAHRSQHLTQELLNWADLALVMEKSQQTHIEKSYQAACGKVMCLGKWQGRTVIDDPYGQTDSAFVTNVAVIHRCVLDWCQKLWS